MDNPAQRGLRADPAFFFGREETWPNYLYVLGEDGMIALVSFVTSAAEQTRGKTQQIMYSTKWLDRTYPAVLVIKMRAPFKRASRMNLLISVSLLLSASVATQPTPIQQQDLSPFFKTTVGAFVLYDSKHDRYIRYNESRCRQRFSPKSTFKIPNSLIGLETGAIRDANFVIAWNRQKYPPQDNWNQEPFVHWAQDHTLRSAIKYSVVWYYRELALRVGQQRMKQFVTRFNYGNEAVSGPIDNFWLDGSLKISANEQVEFLRAFYKGQLPVSRRTTEIVKDILELERTSTYKLSAKTGGGSISEGVYIGWFVGYVETKDNVYFFATNIEGANFAEIRDKRVELTKQILVGLGVLPASAS